MLSTAFLFPARTNRQSFHPIRLPSCLIHSGLVSELESKNASRFEGEDVKTRVSRTPMKDRNLIGCMNLATQLWPGSTHRQRPIKVIREAHSNGVTFLHYSRSVWTGPITRARPSSAVRLNLFATEVEDCDQIWLQSHAKSGHGQPAPTHQVDGRRVSQVASGQNHIDLFLPTSGSIPMSRLKMSQARLKSLSRRRARFCTSASPKRVPGRFGKRTRPRQIAALQTEYSLMTRDHRKANGLLA